MKNNLKIRGNLCIANKFCQSLGPSLHRVSTVFHCRLCVHFKITYCNLAAWSWDTRHLAFHPSGLTSVCLVCSAEPAADLPIWRSSVAFELFLLKLKNLLAFAEGSIATFLLFLSITLILILMPVNGLSNLAEWNTKLLCSWDGAQYYKRGAGRGAELRPSSTNHLFFLVSVCRLIPGGKVLFKSSHLVLRRFERVRLLKSTFPLIKIQENLSPPPPPLAPQPSCECTEFPAFNSFNSVFERMIYGNGESTIRSGP